MKRSGFVMLCGVLLLTLPLVNASAQELAARPEAPASDLFAAAANQKFVPFEQFLEGTQSVSASVHLTRATSRVRDVNTFEEMRQHILAMYRGVGVGHSFVLDSHHFDCVAVAQQPSVRLQGLSRIAEPPPMSAISVKGQAAAGNVVSQRANTADTDQFGNSTSCEAGTIPMRRITLEDMTRFPSLKAFFEKVPGSPETAAAAVARKDIPPAVNAHKYSITYQYVNNLGGNANINLWRPYVYTPIGEIFSLSQEWYVGGSGAATQTAEVGWQNYPAKYGSQNSALFIYWTANNYNGTGCYNLDCAGFVQVSSAWHFGAGFANYSTYGGAQYDVGAEYYLYNGNWWLALGGTWVGYYPGSLYGGGQLTHYAQIIEYGSESVGSTYFPPEGSGQWAYTGWSHAAYQRNVFYINTAGTGIWATLTPYTPSPSCYSIAGPYSSSSSGWQVYFYLGGPGGSGC